MSNLIEAKSGHEGSQVSGPLVGLRVLDISKGVTGALATMIMADYGAEVIKVDPPAGDPLARGPAFRVWNRGKKSIVIDLSQDSGQQTLRQLSRHVDVILETFRPGEAESYDLDYPQLSQVNPGLIYCSISAYGQRGPWKNRHGYEGLVAAASGIMTEQPGVRDGPMFSSIPLATLGACMLALQGILAALHTRNASGKGQKVSTSLYQGALAIRYPMLVFSEKISTLQVNNTSPLGGLPSYRMYPCADGKWIHIGCLTRAFWDKLAVATDCLELATEARFDAAPSSWPNEADRLAAIELIGERLKRRPRSHWLEVLEEGDVPSAPVMTTQEYMDHPQVRHNRMVVSVKDPVLGDMDQMGLVIGFSETPGVVRASAPLLGQHTQEVKSWLSKNPNGPKPLDAESQITGRPRYPLEGMRVLDLSSFIAGPLGSMVLSDLGADVIKVEPIEGEGARAIPFLILGGNRGKRSIALDLKAPISRDIIHRLIKRCDVVVHNMRVGVAERLGIDYGSVRKIQPDVIYVHSTAYGSTGPEAKKPGFDPLFQSMSGVTARQGAGADSPVFLRTPVIDDTNALLLAVSVLMALYHRDRTGQGQKVDLCLMNTGVLVNSDDFMRYKGKPERPLADRELYGLSAAYRLYRAEDGWIFVACELEEEWDLLKQVLGGRWTVQEFSFDRAKAVNPWDVELCRELEAEFARRTAKEWEKRLTDAGAPCVRVARDNQEGFSFNPQALSLGAVSKREHPEYSEVVQPGVLVELSETPTAERPAAPILGEHTIEVLKELGYSESEIQNMEEAGYLATANSR